jgi:hypothetical protein
MCESPVPDVDPSSSTDSDAARALGARRRALSAGRRGRDLRRELVPVLIHRTDALLHERILRVADELGDDVFDRQLSSQVSRIDERPGLRGIAISTLILSAEDDQLCPVAKHEEMNALIPGSQLAILEGSPPGIRRGPRDDGFRLGLLVGEDRVTALSTSTPQGNTQTLLSRAVIPIARRAEVRRRRPFLAVSGFPRGQSVANITESCRPTRGSRRSPREPRRRARLSNSRHLHKTASSNRMWVSRRFGG